MQWLTNNGDYKTGFVYETVMNYATNEDEAKSEALRLLIHYIGDIHQPLHATSRVDSKYPKGDAGGNFFKVPTKSDAKNLHSVWDAVVYLWTETPHLVSFGCSFSSFLSLIIRIFNIKSSVIAIQLWRLEHFWRLNHSNGEQLLN
jgi:hypothetical protein